MAIFLAFAPPHGFDWIIIGAIFVLFFGAKKLPELARGLGKSLGEFKKAKQDFEHELNNSIKEESKPGAQATVPAITPAPGAVAKGTPVTPTPVQGETHGHN